MYEIIILYTLKFHNGTCQSYLNEAGGKIIHIYIFKMHVLRFHSNSKKSESLLFGPGNVLYRSDPCGFGAEEH